MRSQSNLIVVPLVPSLAVCVPSKLRVMSTMKSSSSTSPLPYLGMDTVYRNSLLAMENSSPTEILGSASTVSVTSHVSPYPGPMEALHVVMLTVVPVSPVRPAPRVSVGLRNSEPTGALDCPKASLESLSLSHSLSPPPSSTEAFTTLR